jgi:hypothetical protein
MEKQAIVKEGQSPCEYCGRESVVITGGIPVCSIHIVRPRKEARPNAIQKVADLIPE